MIVYKKTAGVMYLLYHISEAAILALALSIDAFIACLAYGTSKIKIPLCSAVIINIICSGCLALSLLAGGLVKPYLPEGLSSLLCFIILFGAGIIKLLDNIIKFVIRKNNGVSKNIKFSAFSLKFVLSVYADPESADADLSKYISLPEACSLAIALSLDGIAVGFGAALGDACTAAAVVFSFLATAAAVFFGIKVGNKLSEKINLNLSWLTGFVLIVLALAKIIF